MRIALYDSEQSILDKYKALLCDRLDEKVFEIDCYTEQQKLVDVLERYDLVFMTECAMSHLTKACGDDEVILVSGSRVETISIEDIIYIEADLKQVHIFLKNGGEIVIRLTFKDVEQQLKKSQKAFVKVHRSYIVAMDMIRRIQNKSVLLKNGVALPISKYRLQEVIDSYLAYQEKQAIIIRDATEEDESDTE